MGCGFCLSLSRRATRTTKNAQDASAMRSVGSSLRRTDCCAFRCQRSAEMTQLQTSSTCEPKTSVYLANTKQAAVTADVARAVPSPCLDLVANSRRLKSRTDRAKRPARSDAFPETTTGTHAHRFRSQSLLSKRMTAASCTGETSSEPGERGSATRLRGVAADVGDPAAEGTGGILERNRFNRCVLSGLQLAC